MANKRIQVWATADTLSVVIGNTYYKQPITKQQLLYLARLFLSKAMEGGRSE